MAKISVTVQKISGEVLEMEANADDTVTVLQDRVVKDLGVPLLCQKLWINNAPQAMVQKLVPGMSRKMEDIIHTIDRRDISEVKAFMNPPRMVKDILFMVLHLLQIKPTAGGPIFKDCQRMMANPKEFIETLLQFPATVPDVSLKQLKKAQVIADQLASEGKFEQKYFDQCSRLAGILYNWVVLAFKVHKNVHNPQEVDAIEMEGYQTLGVYRADEGAQESLVVALVVDYSDVFARFQNRTGLEEAFDALEMIAAKCPDSSVPALAKELKSWTDSHRDRALDIVKKVFEPNLSLAEQFANELKHFFDEASEEALEALEYLGPSNRRAMQCIISGMNCKSNRPSMVPRRKIKRAMKPMKFDNHDENHAFRQLCLDIFKALEPEADTMQVIDDVMEATLNGFLHKTFSPKDAVQKEVLESLVLVSKRNEEPYDYAVSLILPKLSPPSDGEIGGPHARAAQAAAAIAQKNDEKLVQAFTTLAQHPEATWSMPHLVLVAESFQQISEMRSPFVDKLLDLLGEDPSCEADSINLLAKITPAGDEAVIHRMQRYLHKAHEILHYDGPTVVKAAANCLDQVVTDPAMSEKAYAHLINLLIHRCCGPIASTTMGYGWGRSGRKPSVTHNFLMEVAKKRGGVKSIHLWNIASGFTSTHSDIRFESLRIFKNIHKSSEAKPVFVLFKVLDEKFSSHSCCAAIDALLDCATPNQPEVTDRLLQLLQCPECTVKTAALETLTKFSTDSSLKDPVLKCLDDKDLFVRRAALALLIQRKLLDESDGILLRCLGDSSVDVVLQSLRTLAESGGSASASNEIILKATGLITHADPNIRLEATKLLSAASHDAAREALTVQQVWPEMDEAVREAQHAVMVA